MSRREPSRIRWAVPALLAAVTGCCPPPPPVIPPPLAYFGPTDSPERVIAAINRNAAAVPTLWTQLSYTARIVDPGKPGEAPQVLSGDGALLFRQPGSLRLALNKDVAGAVFELGTNDREFWVKQRTSADAWNYYWGHVANAGKPCCRGVPIPPGLIVQVLGVASAGVDPLRQPVPVMRFDNAADAYVFDFDVRGPDRWLAQREVSYDRRTLRPTRVVLYDATGRAVVIATLANPAPVELPGVPKDQWPTVARHFELVLDTGSTMALDFDEPALTHGSGRRVVPNDQTFFRPEPDENNKEVQVDTGCGEAGAVE